ncbi:MAG: family 16 glycosylhydrolase [Deltaproteobacteria bacterium]|nr:family 16 glycosylhydrolase [Deltaproteobacteria bacterium]
MLTGLLAVACGQSTNDKDEAVDSEKSEDSTELEDSEKAGDSEKAEDSGEQRDSEVARDSAKVEDSEVGGDSAEERDSEYGVDTESIGDTVDGTDTHDTLETAGWQLVWRDEFEGNQIDSSKWAYEVNCWGGGNNEQQCYVDDAKNAYVEDGILHIKAIADNPTGETNPPDNTAMTTLPYSSARLRTKDKGDWKYGRIEARLQLPFGQGIWPAFWMLPTDWEYGGWAASGEIDIMEAVNLSPANNVVYGTLHYGGEWPDNVHSGESVAPDVNVASSFNIYAVEWEAGEIRWYLNDVHYATQTEWTTASGAAFPAPFDQRFHILLNLAVGGNWPGAPNDSTSFPQEMLVDYVRVYQCGADTQTGHGCGAN